MADPITLGTAIVGGIKAAEKLLFPLVTFIKDTVNAPKEAAVVHDEVSGIRDALRLLEQIMLGDSGNLHQTAQSVRDDHLTGNVTATVLTLSELDKILVKMNRKFKIFDRFKWARHKHTIAGIIASCKTTRAL